MRKIKPKSIRKYNKIPSENVKLLKVAIKKNNISLSLPVESKKLNFAL